MADDKSEAYEMHPKLPDISLMDKHHEKNLDYKMNIYGNSVDEKKEGRLKNTLYEFSQSTTMHGVNRITEDTPFTLRR